MDDQAYRDKENSSSDHEPVNMGDVYDTFAEAFAKTDQLPTWVFVGKLAMQRILSDVLKPDSKVLDLGSASARVEIGVVLPAGVRPEGITGVEISPDQVEIAKRRIPGAEFLVGDVSDPELLAGRDGTFDAAFSHMVFEHLDDEQLERTCANVARLLKQGGTFAFVVTHPDKMTDMHGDLVTTYGEFITTAPWGGELHNWRRSIDDTVRIVEGAGFAVELVESLPFPEAMPDGLSAEDEASFAAGLEKYRRYPAIRLALRARKS